MTAAKQPAVVPQYIGPYRIIRKLGEGGMGAVFEALHEAIERRVAIKVLHPEYAVSSEFTARFFNEARAVNRVDHPGLVQIFDYGQLPGGLAYIIMELLKGESLSYRIRHSGGALPLSETLSIGRQLADALAAAHSKQVVHRDLKPDNVMLVPDLHMATGERTKLLDFGIAKIAETGGTGPQIRTRTNAIMGTPQYMSPEQCAGAGGIDTPSDVYSLGVMLYEMLSGHRLFIAEGAGYLMGMHMFQEPTPIRIIAPTMPVPVAELVHRMLCKQKAQRPSMSQVASTLASLLVFAPESANRKLGSSDTSGQDSGTQQPSTPSTLGFVASQIKSRHRLPWFLLVSVIFAVGVSGAGFLFLGRKNSATIMSASGSRNLVPEEKPRSAIVWHIDTVPAAAEVVEVSSGQRLGQSPWHTERAASTGRLLLRLSHPGFASREISLDLGANAVVRETLEKLPEPLPPKPSSPASDVVRSKPALRRPAHYAKPKTLDQYDL